MAVACEVDSTFSREVEEHSHVPVSRCYFCQKCTAGCPVAYAMELKPAQLLRMIQMGQREAVLSSPAIWLCVGCDACGTRCPNQIRLGPMFDTLRQMALEEEYAPEPSVYALHRSFLDSIRMWGRVHEMTMLAEYKMRCLLASPALFFDGIVGDMKMGGDLMVKGKLSFIPERVKNVGEVRKLYAGTKEHAPEEEGSTEEES